jgi:2-keto-4-pentenoate hydratase
MYSDFSLAAGYAVARLLDQEMLAGGAVRVGTKLGFTNQEVWSQVGLDMPFWSPMYDTTVTPRPAGSGPSSPECVAMGRRAELH